MPRTATARQPAAKRGRKNIRIDQDLLDQAKVALGASTETEAVTLALRRVVDKGRFLEGFERIGRMRLDESKINDHHE